MTHNNQQPGSADLPPLPDYELITVKADMVGHQLAVYRDATVEKYARDAIAASRRAAGGEVVGYQMLARPEVFYPASHKPTDIDNFRAVHASLPDVAMPELVELMRAIRPKYGGVGTRDVDVAAQQKRIDRAIELLTAEGSALDILPP